MNIVSIYHKFAYYIYILFYVAQNGVPQYSYPPTENPMAYPSVTPPNLGYPMHAENSEHKMGSNSEQNKQGGFLDTFSKLKGDDDQQGFVTKIFGILACQMIVTVLFVYFVISDKSRIKFVKQNKWLYIVCIVVTIGIMYTLMCFRNIARKVPTNYLLLAVFTLWESYLVSTIASLYQPQSVFLASIYASVLFTVLTLFACFTKGDLGCMAPVIMAGWVLGLLTFVLYFIFPSETMHLIFWWVGLIITCIYVVYDVYLITEKDGLEYDEYIIGALMLYIDLVNLFIYLLSIFGERN